MPDKLRLAVVGCGSISKAHLNAIQKCDRAQLVAVVSRDEGRRNAAASAYGAPRAYSVYEDALTDPGIDALVLCTPSHLHLAHATAAHAVTYTSACSRKPRKDLLVVCQKGTLVLDCWNALRLDGQPLVEEPRDRAYQNAFDKQMAEFVDAALTGREPESSGRQALPSLAVLDAAIESARTGQAVNL